MNTGPSTKRGLFAFFTAVLAVTAQSGCQTLPQARTSAPALGSRSVAILTVDGLQFRDLDRNGRLTPYEDWRLTAAARAADLVSHMTLEEKAGAMMHPVLDSADQITSQRISSGLTRSDKNPAGLASDNNAYQAAAESTRLGIPVTISTDPRNGFEATFGMTVSANGFSQWPDPTGLGAIGDPDVVRTFGRIVAEEYRAVGISMALSPQADVATDPRWARVAGTFGEDFDTVGRLAGAFVEGAQGGPGGPTPTGVATVVKHFAGYGAVKDGWDSHSFYGRYATFPGGRLQDHIAAFRPAFRARSAGVMPTYSILEQDGLSLVAGTFNKVLLTDILRGQEHYEGLVVSDWSVTEDCNGPCLGQAMENGARAGLVGKPWGVQDISRAERVVLAVNSGVDQIGGAADSSPIVDAVRSGAISVARIDDAVRKIMVIKFELGLFENPYVDESAIGEVFGWARSLEAAKAAQQDSMVLLENRDHILPLRATGQKIFLHGVDPDVARAAGFTVVDTPAEADVALIRTSAPWQRPHANFVFGGLQHEGDLDFKPDNLDLKLIQDAAAHVPTLVTVYLERPAILTNIRVSAAALIGNFGASDEALLNLVTGRAAPRGKLPFELPSSMAAVLAQKPDVPHDSRDPLYAYGYGLTY